MAKIVYVKDPIGLAWPVGFVGEKADSIKIEVYDDKIYMVPIKRGIGAGNYERELSFEEMVKRVYLYESYKTEIEELRRCKEELERERRMRRDLEKKVKAVMQIID